MADVDDVLTAAAQVSFQAAEHGDFRGIDQVLPRLARRGSPEAGAWRLAVRAIRWSFAPAAGDAPSLEDAARAAEAGPGVAEIVARACAVMERVAACTFDRPRLGDWIALHDLVVAGGAAMTGSADVTLATARLWARLLAGETDGLEDAASTLSDEASRLGASAELIENTVIRALLALSAGTLAEAIELARRASRMAQSEALPQHEYLANIALARVRRHSGRPHLALHILAALGRVAPSHWSGWIGWETLLAGGRPSPMSPGGEPNVPGPPSALAEQSLRDVLEAVGRGDRTAFACAGETLQRHASAWPQAGQEAAALLAALDPVSVMIPDSIADWCRGETPAIPSGLHGIGIPQGADAQSEATTAYVIARPREGARRFLSPGLALAPAARMLARDSVKAGPRTESGVAALALAGEEGMSRDGFFRSVYGFRFVPYQHRAVLDVLCHRMRGLLGNAGEIRREGIDAGDAPRSPAEAAASPAGSVSIAMALRETIVVPDMRCVLPAADRVLRALATLGATSATAAADSLRMPLRTVQALLQQLVAEGACTIHRDGRHVAYRIEDTTFTQVASV